MRKLILLGSAVLLTGSVYAGGIVTNTNQSASFIRMPARDASLGIDAAYYNPAGLVFLKNGFHFSLNNQYISQERTITSTFPGMNQSEFIGTVTAPLFPSVYGVYKKDKLAVSLSLNPIGGGGSAFFEDGLPSFERQVAVLPPSLSAAGIPTTAYNFDTEFDGSSLIWGFQANAAYAITEKLSASLGVRYLTAKNTYTGYLNSITINPNQPAFGANYNGVNMVSAPTFFTDAATTLNTWSVGATQSAAGLQQIINGGGGALLLTDAPLTSDQKLQMQGLIMAAGQNPAGVDVQTANAILTAAAPSFAANAAVMTGYAAATADKSVDAMQTGTGIVPVIGLNYSVSPNFNIAVRYEHKAAITLTNETTVDDVGLYPDGVETSSDMPANLSVGVAFKPVSKLNLSVGYHFYLDKSANYGKKIGNDFVDNSEVIDNNFWEAAFGAEYEVTDKILVSAGYLRTQTGVNDKYHSDLSHSLSTNSISLGGRYLVNENIGINLGFMNTSYISYTKLYTTPVNFQEEYNRKAMVVAVGVDFSF
jgi:long-chain fatty acid transport protein